MGLALGFVGPRAGQSFDYGLAAAFGDYTQLIIAFLKENLGEKADSGEDVVEVIAF